MHFAIFLAAGNGGRAQVPNKLFFEVNKKPLLWYPLSTLHNHPQIDQIVLVIRDVDQPQIKKWLEEWKMANVLLTTGGETRQKSAQNGFKKLPKVAPNDLLLFHNAANPFVTAREITQTLKEAKKTGAAFVAHPAVDTLKQVGKAVKTLDRTTIFHAQTPQVVRADLYKKALEAGVQSTDEMMLVEALGIRPEMVLASADNIKVTTPRDLEFARFLLKDVNIRTGIGQDSHKFDREHKGLTLGGVHLSEHPKTDANSDGDVMIHALCNAILQALGEGSFSKIADPMCKQGITDSSEYLKKILKKMTTQGFTITHAGFQLEGATPQIDPLTGDLKSSLSELLSLDPSRIGITSTTGEGLTPFGRGEGIQCLATVTLKTL